MQQKCVGSHIIPKYCLLNFIKGKFANYAGNVENLKDYPYLSENRPNIRNRESEMINFVNIEWSMRDCLWHLFNAKLETCSYVKKLSGNNYVTVHYL